MLTHRAAFHCSIDEGQIWSCGWGKYGQLGPQQTSAEALSSELPSSVLLSIPDRYTFERVAGMGGHDGVQVNGLVCGLWNTFLWT